MFGKVAPYPQNALGHMPLSLWCDDKPHQEKRGSQVRNRGAEWHGATGPFFRSRLPSRFEQIDIALASGDFDLLQ